MPPSNRSPRARGETPRCKILSDHLIAALSSVLCVQAPPPGFGVSSILLPFPQHPIMLRNDGITDKAQGSKCLDRFMGFNESGGQHLTQPLSCVEGI